MKIILTLLLIVTIFASLMAQRPGMYPPPMSDAEFSEALRYINKESFDKDKMLVAKRMIDGNFLYSHQVKKLVKQFSFKDSEEEVAMYAYPKTCDQNRFYMVYDAFTFSSSKQRVSDWVSQQPVAHNHVPINPPVPVNPIPVDPYYPPIPMSDAEFAEAKRYVKKESFDKDKMLVAKRIVDGNFLYSHQVQQLVKLFSFKGNQEEIAKYAYPKTYDQKRYYIVGDAFTFSFSKAELNRWLETQPINDYGPLPPDPYHPPHGGGMNDNPNLGGGGFNGNNGQLDPNWNNGGDIRPNDNGDIRPNGNGTNPNLGGNGNMTNPNLGGNGNIRPNGSNGINSNLGGNGNINSNNNPNTNNPTGMQGMSSHDFNNVKTQLSALASDQSKVERAKQITDQTYWYAHQVSELCNLLIFEDQRLELAKYAYTKTVDPEQYNLVENTLSQVTNKRNLADYIQSMGGSSMGNTSNNPNNTAGGLTQAMSSRDFETVRAEISAIPADANKLTRAKQIMDSNFLYASQVKELVVLFVFEDVRLDFAKYAYRKTYDPANYAIVKAEFSPSKQQDLQYYIDNY